MDVVEGRVIQFDADGGYGFIRAEGFDEDVFFHVNDVARGGRSVRVGSAVECEVSEGDRGFRADDVVLLDLPGDGPTDDVSAQLTESLLRADSTLTSSQILNVRNAVMAFIE